MNRRINVVTPSRWLFFPAVMSLLIVCGCATPPEAIAEAAIEPEVLGTQSDEQREALQDGLVSYDEYQTSFERFVSCASSIGVTVTLLGEENKVYNFQVPAEELDALEAEYDACYATEFEEVDRMWQLSREDTSPLAQELAECLRAWDLEVPERFVDRVDALESAGIDIVECEKL
ncbi:MAG: hypothetical protein ACK5LN_10530 [Propioniciclava sp.]